MQKCKDIIIQICEFMYCVLAAGVKIHTHLQLKMGYMQ